MIRSYYFTLQDANDELIPFTSRTFHDVYEDAFGTSPEDYFSECPIDFEDRKIEKMWQQLVATNYKKFIFKINKEIPEEPTEADCVLAFRDWLFKLLTQVVKTYDYYVTLLSAYSDAEDSLMADIKATSKNKVKFNDTPQNPNSDDIYEGDNYITHFTATEGETSSPLMSKMMRLKEIQDHYKEVMDDWVREVSRVFFTEGE